MVLFEARFARVLPVLVLVLAACTAPPASAPAGPTTAPQAAARSLKVGWCSNTVTSAAAPFSIAREMGWLKQENIEVQVIPAGGSTACVQQAATGGVDVAIASMEPVAIGRQASKGLKAKIFYTAYQGNIYSIAVPDESPIKELKDLKGKRIGVTNMTSGGVPVAKALAKSAGLDPESEIQLVTAGEGAQTASLIKTNQVDALAQFDTQYALVENAGIKLRFIRTPEFDAFPSNGFVSADDWIPKNQQAAIALGRIYAQGTIFAIANPDAAIRIFWKHNPDAKPTGKSDADALKDESHVLQARIANWKLDKGGVKKWGENNSTNYANYVKYLQDQGLITEPVKAEDFITNELIEKINNFDAQKVQEQAKAWKN
jgi:NitT/TauT family transport system substrate-binding protein